MNTQNLLKLAELVENKTLVHDMRTVVSECGTTSCMMGDWILYKRLPNHITRIGYITVASQEFDISIKEAAFLFNYFFNTGLRFRCRGEETKEQSLARLRKFIYYKLRKQEIFADYERARTQEGNWYATSSYKQPETYNRLIGMLQ